MHFTVHLTFYILVIALHQFITVYNCTCALEGQLSTDEQPFAGVTLPVLLYLISAMADSLRRSMNIRYLAAL